MDTEGRRRSDNFEDRGAGGGRFAREAGGRRALFVGLLRTFGVRGTLILVAVIGVDLPGRARRDQTGDPRRAVRRFVRRQRRRRRPWAAASARLHRRSARPATSLASCSRPRRTCGRREFQKGALPDYGRSVSAYRNPTLVVFSDGVATGLRRRDVRRRTVLLSRPIGKLYIDPSFYDTMARRLQAPGDFAQAYVLAHEVGHHVQNLIGAQGI